MLYVLLIFVIVYLLYKERQYGMKARILVNFYLTLLKFNYLGNKKQTRENLKLYISLLNETLLVSEWNRTLRILAEAWETTPTDSRSSIVDGDKTMDKIIEKLEYAVKDPEFVRLIKIAKDKLKVIDWD